MQNVSNFKFHHTEFTDFSSTECFSITVLLKIFVSEFWSDYCTSPAPLVLPAVQVFDGSLSELCGLAGASLWSSDSCWEDWRGSRELCMMWASNISSKRSYKGTMFFIFMPWRWSMPLLLHIWKEQRRTRRCEQWVYWLSSLVKEMNISWLF